MPGSEATNSMPKATRQKCRKGSSYNRTCRARPNEDGASNGAVCGPHRRRGGAKAKRPAVTENATILGISVRAPPGGEGRRVAAHHRDGRSLLVRSWGEAPAGRLAAALPSQLLGRRRQRPGRRRWRWRRRRRAAQQAERPNEPCVSSLIRREIRAVVVPPSVAVVARLPLGRGNLSQPIRKLLKQPSVRARIRQVGLLQRVNAQIE